MEFQITLAGKHIEIHSLYEQVHTLCLDYLSEATPDFQIRITPADLAFERAQAAREALREGQTPEAYLDAYLETLSVYRKIAVKLLDFDTLLMHGSAVCADGEAVLFTAPSGVGKTTHTRLWLEQIPGSYVVNGDKPLLRLTGGRAEVCGTPWAGKEGMNRNVIVPMRAICLLERGEQNHILRAPFRELYPQVMQQIYRPTEPEAMQKTLALLRRLGQSAAFYRLACNREPEAAHVAWAGTREEGEKQHA